MNSNSTLFPQYQLAKSGLVMQDKYEANKVIKYCKAPRTSVTPYKIHGSGYLLKDDQ